MIGNIAITYYTCIMNINEIKGKLGLQSLSMVRQMDKATQAPQPWLSHWDNENRVRVTMHEDIFNLLKADKNTGGLAYKTEVVAKTDTREEYTRIMVITPKNVEAEF